ncbi:Cytochrome P450 71C4 [Hordeum vulgare]|nr:Cytochrome P450 71C4 [Hordeum vulgare]
MPYPDVTLSHHWHMDPERIPVSAVPRSARVHAEEVRRYRRLLTPEQRQNLACADDSPNWELWFTVEHEVRDEDQEAETAYQAAVAAVLRDSEAEEWHRADEEAAYQ